MESITPALQPQRSENELSLIALNLNNHLRKVGKGEACVVDLTIDTTVPKSDPIVDVTLQVFAAKLRLAIGLEPGVTEVSLSMTLMTFEGQYASVPMLTGNWVATYPEGIFFGIWEPQKAEDAPSVIQLLAGAVDQLVVKLYGDKLYPKRTLEPDEQPVSQQPFMNRSAHESH